MKTPMDDVRQTEDPHAAGAVRTMIKHIPMGLRWLMVVLIALSSALEANAAAGNDDALIGQKYEIVGELYAHSVAHNLNSRVVSIIDLVPLRLRGPEIISCQLVPIGSILTIVEKAPKRRLLALARNRGSIDGAKSANFQATI